MISKFGVDTWHLIKQKAGCDIADGGFLKFDAYPDESTMNLVMAASEIVGLSPAGVLQAFGAFFFSYVKDQGYDNLLHCQGSTVKEFLLNVNAIHKHLQSTFPKKMKMPQFWVEDNESGDGSLILHYHSKRGNLLAPVVEGLASEIASCQFGVEIKMARLKMQDEAGSAFTR